MRIVSIGMLACCAGSCLAQTIQPPFNLNYTFNDLGSVPGVPGPYGGLTIDQNDSNFLLIGGSANNANGAIYRIEVERNDCGSIVGFVGTATLFATAPNIDGGLAYGPDGVLFATTFNNNRLLQILPGATAPARTIELGPLGVSSSTGTLAFVPEGFPGAGALKIASYSASIWYDFSLTSDGIGTFDIARTAAPSLFIGGGPEGIAYVTPDSPVFGTTPHVLVSEFAGARIVAYEIDGNGDPIIATRRPFMTGLAGAEGAFLDTTSGDFLFSTFGGGSRVIVVQGFAEEIVCDGIDFNNDGLFPDDADLIDFLSVLAGGECSTGDCNQVDFNNDCLFPDDGDIVSFLEVLAGGTCP